VGIPSLTLRALMMHQKGQVYLNSMTLGAYSKSPLGGTPE
jgi:hypothetical protein